MITIINVNIDYHAYGGWLPNVVLVSNLVIAYICGLETLNYVWHMHITYMEPNGTITDNTDVHLQCKIFNSII